MENNITNNLEYTVSELSLSIKHLIEDNFEFIRLRGEIGRVSKPGSGHIYLDLKDDSSVISGVIWKGNTQKLNIAPEEGLEVVCLGKIGRNFAAGMSGGIAYIYNPEKDFESLLNQEMVEIENVRFQKKNNRKNLRGISEINKNMLINDEYRLKYLLRRHVLYTNSSNARQILENWQELYKNFVKITPLDYRRALLEKSKNNFIKASVA